MLCLILVSFWLVGKSKLKSLRAFKIKSQSLSLTIKLTIIIFVLILHFPFFLLQKKGLMFSISSKLDHRSLTMSLSNHERRMSDQSSINTATRTSSLKHQQHKPRELKVEYSAVSQKAIVKSTETVSDTQVIYVYCSPRLKHTLIFIFRFLLIAYCVTVPIFVFILHQKSNENISKINEFEAAFKRHVHLTTSKESDSKTGSGGNIEGSRKRRDVERAQMFFNKSYKQNTTNDEELERKMKEFNDTIVKYRIK